MRTSGMGRRGLLLGLMLAGLLVGCQKPTEESRPVVFAAASLQDVLTDASEAWTRKGHAPPIISFAASSALARQIESGAGADLFISADEAWMDALQAKGLVDPASRAILASNRLVLVAPRAQARSLDLASPQALEAALGDGRLAIADPDAVPAGRYGRAALIALGHWPRLETRLAPAENVRAAMALVERGVAPLGVVYATDAQASDKVAVVAVFPAETHPRILYPVARLARSDSREAEAFQGFLTSDEAEAIFAARGFVQGDR